MQLYDNIVVLGIALNMKGNKKVPKYLEKRRKSIDANQTFRRSNVRKRSCSGTRNILKAVSSFIY